MCSGVLRNLMLSSYTVYHKFEYNDSPFKGFLYIVQLPEIKICVSPSFVREQLCE